MIRPREGERDEDAGSAHTGCGLGATEDEGTRRFAAGRAVGISGRGVLKQGHSPSLRFDVGAFTTLLAQSRTLRARTQRAGSR